jgi:hypothetical protein
MSVHVSLHPAVAPTVESAKAAEPSNSAANFSHALNAAAEAAQTESAHDAGDHDAPKKQQKKAESSKDSQTAALATKDASAIQPSLPVAVQTIPTTPPSVQAADEPVEEQVDGLGNGATATSSVSGSVMNGGTLSIGMRPVHVANPIISSAQGGTDVSTPTASDDDISATSVEDGNAPASEAIPSTTDETSVPSPGIDSTVTGLTNIAKGAPPKSLLLNEDGPVVKDQAIKDQPILGQSDSAQTAAPVSLPLPVASAPSQPVPASLPGGLDLNTMMTSATPVVAATEAKEFSAKPGSAGSKDRAVSDVRGHRKADDSDVDSQSGAATAPTPVRFSVAADASSGQGDSRQSAAKDVQPLQTPQANLTSPVADGQVTPHAAAATPASDAQAQTLPTNTAAADALLTPTLSGARLIQSIHQSEMKLGMNSAEFGNISISTSVTHQALSAQISLDHSELGRALAAHLPAMEEKLSNAYGLQAKVEVNDGGSNSYARSSQHSGEGRQERQNGSSRPTSYSSGLTSVPARSISTPVAESARLDIRI